MEQILSQHSYGQDLSGVRGKTGASLYETWLAAGHVGTIEDFFDAMIAAGGINVANTAGLFSVTNRALMAAIVAPTNGQPIYLADDLRPGWYKFSTANLAAQVAADVLGNYVTPNADHSGASGAWVRQVTDQSALAGVLARLAVLEDEIRQGLPVLVTGGASYHSIYATYLLVPTYTGPLLRVIRNSDNVEVDLYPTGKTIAPGDIKALRGAGAVLRIVKWYDQSPNARHATQVTAARQPGLHEDAYWNGVPVILFDGGVNFIGGPGGRGFDLPANMTGQACAMFAVTDFKQSTDQQFLFAFSGSSGVGRVLFHNYTANASIVHDATFRSAFKQKQFRTGMAVYGVREKVGPLDLFINGVPTAAVSTADMLSPGATPPAETLNGGVLGYTAAAGFANYQPNFRMTAFVTITGASPSDADCIALTRALQSNVAIPSQFDSRHIFIGDSILAGGAATLTLDEMWYLRQQSLNNRREFYNISIPSKTLIACYNDRLMFDDVLYTASLPVVPDFQPGSNDLNNSVTAAALWAELTTYVGWWLAKGNNVRPIVQTILKRTDFSAAKETERVNFNALVRAGWAGIGAAALNDVDAALAAIDPNYSTNVALLSDGVHPTSHAQALLAPSYEAAQKAALA